MLNGRLYRAAFLPFLLALAIAAFSLGPRPRAFTSTLAPDAFEGQAAFAELRALAASFPDRRPGDGGDRRLALYVRRKLEALGGAGGGGFSVHTYDSQAQTIDGARTVSTVVAQRPGSTDEPPLAIVAHRDAAAHGAVAELSGTAALLELARVLSTRETKRRIVLVSSSGGSGGDGSAAVLASEPATLGVRAPLDAAVVIGDVAGTSTRSPMVLPFSDGLGSAPLELQRTVAQALAGEAGVQSGEPSVLGQLAHLAFPLATGEQGVLDAAGVPAVLVQVSGEDGPSPQERVSPERLEGVGRSLLSAVDALDAAPDVSRAMQTGVQLHHKTMPMWALRLLVGTLLLPVLVAGLDGLARARRRKLAVGAATLWTLSCALPFMGCAVFAYLLGLLGVLGATPPTPVLASALPLGARALTAVIALTFAFAFAWLLWASLVQRMRWGVRGDPEVAGLTAVLVLCGVAAFAWLADPFTALLAVPALHAWLAFAGSERYALVGGRRRVAGLALLAIGVAPVALLIAFYARQLGLGVGEVAWTALLLTAGGHVGFFSALLWSAAFGCAAAVAIVIALGPRPDGVELELGEDFEVTIRGPLSYAGPGSLGGTESALRR